MTERTRRLGLAGFPVVCLGAGGFRDMATTPEIDGWSRTLDKPVWTPPDAVFGPVWTTVQLMMAIVAGLVRRVEGFAAARRVFFGRRQKTGEPFRVKCV